MKLQFVFLSLFLATAHAGHEPKGLRGRVGGDDQDQDLELLDLGYTHTVVPKRSSATINCGSGSHCCVTGSFKQINNQGGFTLGNSGGGGCQGFTMANGNLSTCASQSCSISCEGTCNVSVTAGGSGGGSGGSGSGGGGYGGGYKIPRMPKMPPMPKIPRMPKMPPMPHMPHGVSGHGSDGGKSKGCPAGQTELSKCSFCAVSDGNCCLYGCN